jgi:hypothetical protein
MNLSFDVHSVRKLESPYDREGRRTHMAVVGARNLPPELGTWREVNPRDANVKSYVSRQIRQTLQENPEMFFFRNRGLVVTAKSVKFDNAANRLTLVLDDKEKHGIIDGGHTFKVVRDFLEDPEAEKEKELVDPILTMQVISGFDDLDDIVDLVEARNTSRQVREDSIEGMRGLFKPIQRILAREPYANKVSYSEFTLGADNLPRPVNVRDVLAMLICFDIDTFSEDNHPHRAYHSKHAVLQHFKKNEKRMKKLAVLLPDILKLRDMIYRDWPTVYKEVGGPEGGSGKVGSVAGLTVREKATIPLHFVGGMSQFSIPDSYIYPVLAAFRTLVRRQNGGYSWRKDPDKIFESHKEKLIKRIASKVREFKSPNRVGKDTGTWEICYITLARALGQ